MPFTRQQDPSDVALAIGHGRVRFPLSALQAAVAAARERKLAQLQLVRDGCRERGITVGQPAFKALRRTDALPFIDEVANAGVAAPPIGIALAGIWRVPWFSNAHCA